METLRDKNGLTEEQFLRQYNSDKYPKPALTADILIFRKTGDDYHLLMIRRKGHPYLGCIALPGGFANKGETIAETAARELFEETGVSNQSLKLVGVYSKPGRDPRGWTVSAAYAALVDGNDVKPVAGDDAESVHWIPLKADDHGSFQIVTDERIAFDHEEIIHDAILMMLSPS